MSSPSIRLQSPTSHWDLQGTQATNGAHKARHCQAGISEEAR
jgi:hypothetical protein